MARTTQRGADLRFRHLTIKLQPACSSPNPERATNHPRSRNWTVARILRGDSAGQACSPRAPLGNIAARRLATQRNVAARRCPMKSSATMKLERGVAHLSALCSEVRRFEEGNAYGVRFRES